ncbi:hypothetical protein D1872_235030 [compost metagenome]
MLFDRPHQPLVGVHLLVRQGVADFRPIAKSLDIVQVVLEQRFSRFFERIHKRLLHFLLGQFIIFPAGDPDKIEIPLPFFFCDGSMLVQTVLDRPQNIERAHAVQILFDQRAGDPVDNIPRVDSGHPFLQILVLELL